MLGNNSNFSKFQLSEKFITSCTCAKSALEEMCNLIETGAVTLIQLSILKEKEDRVNELLKAAITGTKMKVIQQKLKLRFHEQALFDKWLNRLKQVCQYLSIPIKGMLELLEA